MSEALGWLTVRRAGARRSKSTCAFSGQGWRRACHGAGADPPPVRARRRETAMQGDGRVFPTQPCAPDSRMDGVCRIKGGDAAAEWRDAARRRPQTCQPRGVSPPQAERPLRRGAAARDGRIPKAILRLASGADIRADALYARRSTVGAIRRARIGDRHSRRAHTRRRRGGTPPYQLAAIW